MKLSRQRQSEHSTDCSQIGEIHAGQPTTFEPRVTLVRPTELLGDRTQTQVGNCPRLTDLAEQVELQLLAPASARGSRAFARRHGPRMSSRTYRRLTVNWHGGRDVRSVAS